jgi:general stress protein 26
MCDREHCPLGDKYDFTAEDKAFVDKIRKRLAVKLSYQYDSGGERRLYVELFYKDGSGEEYEITSDYIYTE